MRERTGPAFLGATALWRRLALHPLALIAFSLLVIRFAPPPALRAHAVSDVAVAGIYLLAGIVIVSALLALARPRLEWRWDNHTLEGRVAHFVDMLSLAHRSVVIVTGSLHHNLFNEDEVVCALEALPDGVAIKVFHEDPLDDRSGRFRRELTRRRASLCAIAPNQISHGLIIDAKHCKVEEFGVDDDESEKRAQYFMFAPRRARRALDQIEAVVLDTVAPNLAA